MGGGDSVLEAELECLIAVLGNPQRYLHFDSQHLRLNRMNLVLDESSTQAGADINFSVAETTGSIPMSRAFILIRVPRAELPPAKKINFDAPSRYL